MQMIRKHHRRFDGDGMADLHVAKSGAKDIDVLGQQARSAVGQIDGEEAGLGRSFAGSWSSTYCFVARTVDGFRIAREDGRKRPSELDPSYGALPAFADSMIVDTG
jgi:hypothetical protein